MITACVILPSRKRFCLLLRALQSLYDTADYNRYEVRIKLDDDDSESTSEESLKALKSCGNVTVTVSPRMEGYKSINLWATALADQSDAKWIMIFNDDAIVHGRWEEQLREVPETGFIAHPEIHRLNNSKYFHDQTSAFPFVPNGCWREYGKSEIGNPADHWLDELLRVNNGWQPTFLKGVTIHHDRTGIVPA